MRVGCKILCPLCPQTDLFYLIFYFCLPGKNLCAQPSSKFHYTLLYAYMSVFCSIGNQELDGCQGIDLHNFLYYVHQGGWVGGSLSYKCCSIELNTCSYSLLYILYSTKWQQRKTLTNLANLEQFAKVLPIQIYIIKLWVDSMMNECQTNSEHAWKL